MGNAAAATRRGTNIIVDPFGTSRDMPPRGNLGGTRTEGENPGSLSKCAPRAYVGHTHAYRRSPESEHPEPILLLPMDKAVSAFYCCYLLRSTKRHASLYIGSTPHPRRRLAQHNGQSQGGAVRTARESLRPWEMVCIVTGFPSNIAALQFEWAWQNTHLTKKVASGERTTERKTTRKTSRAGREYRRPVRPPLSLDGGLTNLHLLLRSPSFARWPLQLRVFCDDVDRKWQKKCDQNAAKLRVGLKVIRDVPVEAEAEAESGGEAPPPSAQGRANGGLSDMEIGGVAGLAIGYADVKPHLEKSLALFKDGGANRCSICSQDIGSEKTTALICSVADCSAMMHMNCLAANWLAREIPSDALIPTEGPCPECLEELQWIALIREMTLRTRGGAEVARILKPPRAKKTKGGKRQGGDTVVVETEVPDSDVSSAEESEDSGGDIDNDEPPDDWHGASEADARSVTSYDSDSSLKPPARPDPVRRPPSPKLAQIIEDSEWDSAEVLD